MKQLLRRVINSFGYDIHSLPVADTGKNKTSNEKDSQQELRRHIYDQDGLRSIHNHDFMFNLDFTRAYNRGRLAAGEDYHFHWRVHIALWAAYSAMRLNGDYVECGVNRGFISSAIMEFLDWNQHEQTFYLLDTFNGIDPSTLSEDDLQHGVLDRNKALLASEHYVKSAESVKINFSQWQNVRIVEGSIPQTLPLVDSAAVAYLHLDLNCAGPEIEAIKYFWNRLLPGAIILLDDYAYCGYESQKRAWDAFASQKGVMIASLPTGQGLLLKPPSIE